MPMNSQWHLIGVRLCPAVESCGRVKEPPNNSLERGGLYVNRLATFSIMTDEFSIKLIPTTDVVTNPSLREHIRKTSVPSSHVLLAYTTDGSEAGYLSIEFNESYSVAFIYFIFVLPRYRKRGLGSAILNAGEQYADNRGFSCIWLKPRSLSLDTDEDRLVKWYSRHGYKWSDDGEHMEKVLTN